jgi:hypothetical protein
MWNDDPRAFPVAVSDDRGIHKIVGEIVWRRLTGARLQRPVRRQQTLAVTLPRTVTQKPRHWVADSVGLKSMMKGNGNSSSIALHTPDLTTIAYRRGRAYPGSRGGGMAGS